MNSAKRQFGLWLALCLSLPVFNAGAQNGTELAPDKARIANYWTGERRAAAIPRDLVIDHRGLGYLKGRDGVLHPYGHNVAFEITATGTPAPAAGKPSGGSGDTTPPSVDGMDPAPGATIGASYTFAATVADASGLRSVTFKIAKNGARAKSFSATNTSGSVWSVGLQGFTDGSWTWQVVAKDKAGNTTTSQNQGFTVNTTSGGGGGNVITNARWSGGAVQKAAGRVYFEMPYNGGWGGFVCSGTVATDETAGRSLIVTAAHCVYDDANKVFARNVLFIPDQDDGGTDKTDLNCGNDPMGCWLPTFGVVDTNWTTRTFPNNVAWDYAYYVVSDTGAHTGTTVPSAALDQTAGALAISFDPVSHDTMDSSDYTTALGYSYKDDPNFMYCAQDMTTNGTANWWLADCGLSGGASGGPWVQPMDDALGSGPIISVNSWGYVDRFGNSLPGMAGAKLVDTSANCVFGAAKQLPFPTTPPADGKAGSAVTCP
ncbi:Ig-like domain-containing protein [Aromatoleum evansii]|uniref:Ig-like domain-containing protein n=1 Tax=Aromatoleum evansii TaxID=59406 RepID=UPI00145CC890|nr:Ig-like domain-containing protein [Aromatoleum evansii]NMG30474.1 hypothetical protein [Aromatoleum evansii]